MQCNASPESSEKEPSSEQAGARPNWHVDPTDPSSLRVGRRAFMIGAGLVAGTAGAKWLWNYTEGLDGWLFPRFFYHYGVGNIDILAPLQAAAIDDYVNTFDINQGDADRQMVTQWALFGDPSLKIGGYP